jgi:hypothetical protein
VVRAAGSHVADTRPGSIAVAGLLLLAAGALVLTGLESLGAGGLKTMGAGDVPDDESMGGRVHATVDGGILSSYVETYLDADSDGTQDEDETGDDWAYFMVDPETRDGVTVLSIGPPWEVFTGQFSGEVATDGLYVDETPYIAEELAAIGVTLDPEHIIDARVAGTPTAHTLGDPMPADGSLVTVTGSRSVGYATSCSVDVDGDGTCGPDEVDTFDVAIFDRATGVGILIITEDDPDLLPATFTGMLRSDPSTVSDMVNAPGPTLEDYGITVSPTYLLEVGATPADPAAAMLLGLLAGLLAAVILAGVAGGYVGYRKVAGRPAGATTLSAAEAIPVRLTGVVRGPTGDSHVRDVPAVVRRFVPATVSAGDLATEAPEPAPAAESGPVADMATATPDPAAIPVESTVIVERVQRPEGVALGMGELRTLSVGTATTFRGSRPAIRATAGTGQLILSFDDEAARDRVVAELVAEAGLDLATTSGPDTAAPVRSWPDAAPPSANPPVRAWPDAAPPTAPEPHTAPPQAPDLDTTTRPTEPTSGPTDKETS